MKERNVILKGSRTDRKLNDKGKEQDKNRIRNERKMTEKMKNGKS